MGELMTDQRLSALLLPLVKEQGDAYNVTRQNAQTLRETGEAQEAAAVQDHLAMNFGKMTDRLGELVEGLAAGTVRIVDEVALVRSLSKVIEQERADAADPAALSQQLHPIRVAQLVLQDFTKTGALR